MLTLRGATGELCIAARPVARLGRWTMTCEGQRATLVGKVAQVLDEYLLERCNVFELCIPAGRVVWRWRAVQVVTDGRDVTITMEGRRECLETVL